MKRCIRPVRLVRAPVSDPLSPIHRASSMTPKWTLCGLRIRHAWPTVELAHVGRYDDICARCSARMIKVDEARRAA